MMTSLDRDTLDLEPRARVVADLSGSSGDTSDSLSSSIPTAHCLHTSCPSYLFWHKGSFMYRKDRVPFSSVDKHSAVIIKTGEGRHVLVVTGAPERVVEK